MRSVGEWIGARVPRLHDVVVHALFDGEAAIVVVGEMVVTFQDSANSQEF